MVGYTPDIALVGCAESGVGWPLGGGIEADSLGISNRGISSDVEEDPRSERPDDRVGDTLKLVRAYGSEGAILLL